MKHTAFTLMEIIFTILILGFIATGMPMILATDLDSREESLVQEAIYASVAKMAQILSYKWDDASNQDITAISGAKVLDIPASASADAAFNRNGSKFRVGHFQETGRRSFYSANTNASFLGNDINDIVGAVSIPDDIDDAVAPTLLSPSTSSIGYKEVYTINVIPHYITDTSVDGYINSVQNGFDYENDSGTRTNIKRILVEVLDSNNQRLFTLRTYSSNIGESSVSSRIFN